MAPAFSKLTPIHLNCYEVGHTWTPYCAQAASDLGYSCFKESLRIYTSVYVFSLIASRKFPKNRDDIQNLLQDILRSSVFLTTNAVGFIQFFCLFRKLFGSFNFWSLGFLPTFAAAYIAIQIEKPRRRAMLALYVTNVATDAMFRMLRARGIVGNIKHFDLALFLLSILTVLYQKKKGNQKKDIVDAILTKIIGNEEFTKRERNVPNPPEERIFNPEIPQPEPEAPEVAAPEPEINPNPTNIIRPPQNQRNTFRNRFVHFVLWMHKAVEDIACHLERLVNAVNEGSSHELCQHQKPCLDYWLNGFWTRFVSGFGIQGTIQLGLYIKRLMTAKKSRNAGSRTNAMLYKCIQSGLGLSSLCCGFRIFSCSFRWLQGSDDPINSIASAIIPTILTFFLLKPPPTVSLYVFFKALETLIAQSHRDNNWKIIRWLDSVYGGGWSLLYAFSTAILFHAGMLEPQNLKSSYQVFLSKVTGGRIYDINRHMFTIYGSQSDYLQKTFWPKFKTKYLSNLMKQIIQEKDLSSKKGITGNVALREITRKLITGV